MVIRRRCVEELLLAHRADLSTPSNLLSSMKYCDIPKPETRMLARRKSSRTVTIISRAQ
jgi:hypothetical protein